MTLKESLIDLINTHSLEGQSDTPDFLLAQFLLDCLEAYEKVVRENKEWQYGVSRGSRVI